MSSTLAGLGAIAGGLSRGLADGQRLAGDMEDRAYQRDQRLRQRTLQDRDDALNADLEAANAAMRERLQGFASEHSRTQGPGPRNNLLLGGTDGSMPDQTANDTPSAAPAGFRPTEEQLLDAAQARTNTLFARGRHDAAVKQWVQDEGLRGQLRKQAAQRGLLAYKSTGDIAPLLSGIYKHLDDGYELSGVEPVNNPDPKAPRSWTVQRRNTVTGETKTDRIGADEVDGLIQFALDPVQAAKYSLMEKLAGFKGDQQRETNRERGELTLDQIERRNEGAMAVAETRGDAARDVAKIRVDGTITAAKIRAAAGGGSGGKGGTGGNIAKTQNLSDGRVLLIMRDGSQRIATDDNGKALTSLEFEKLVGSTAKTVGKSLDGLTATPEANQERARKLLPKQPASGAKRLVYDPATGSFK
jgi:hypothetical protein